ncbi:COMM domain-containing protein 1-like isoform X2 [Tubulanus polymorphus]|uniref:COMM domain-containing protein 1-like isoform X2 n=1 Tax=Tubulanus polymorphus TaxID=672921 RepID=UPI003DA69FDF
MDEEKRFQGLLNGLSIASADMDFNQLDAFLTSQTRRKEGAITAEQSKAYIKFWKTHKNKVHEKMVSQSIWSNRLKNICWRIDIKSQTRSSDQINTPTAIMELQFSNNRKKDDDVLTFEMDESKLSSVLSSLQEIEGKLNSYQTHE